MYCIVVCLLLRNEFLYIFIPFSVSRFVYSKSILIEYDFVLLRFFELIYNYNLVHYCFLNGREERDFFI